MSKVTQLEYQALDRVARGFSNGLIERDPSAVERFTESATPSEKFNLIAGRLSIFFTQYAGYHRKAGALIKYCEAAVPGLVRTFGEATVVEAISEQDPNENIAKRVEELGGTKLAPLIRKALAL